MLSSDDEAYNTNWTDDISSLTDFAEEVDLPCILNESPTLGAKRRDNLTRDWARSPVAQPKVSWGSYTAQQSWLYTQSYIRGDRRLFAR